MAFRSLKRESGDIDPGMYDSGMKRSRASDMIETRLLIPSKVAGSIIGKGGSKIQQLRSDNNAKVRIPDCPGPERVMTIQTDDTQAAVKVIEQALPFMSEENAAPPEVRLLVHDSIIGGIIGNRGAKIKEIRASTGAHVKVYETCAPQSNERCVAVGGSDDEKIVSALEMIIEIVQTNDIRGEDVLFDPINFDGVYGAEYGGYGSERDVFGGPSSIGRNKRGRGAFGNRGSFGSGRGGRFANNPGNFGGNGADGFGASESCGFGGNISNEFGNSGLGSTPAASWPNVPGFAGNNTFGGNAGGFGRNVNGFGGAGANGFGGAGTFFGNNQMKQSGGLGPSGLGMGESKLSAEVVPGPRESSKVTIPNHMAGSIIGPGGSRIRNIRQESKCQIELGEVDEATQERVITIFGPEKSIQMAQYLLQKAVKENS